MGEEVRSTTNDVNAPPNAPNAGNGNALEAAANVPSADSTGSLNQQENAAAAAVDAKQKAANNARQTAKAMENSAAQNMKKLNNIQVVKKQLAETSENAKAARESAAEAQQVAVEKSASVQEIQAKARMGDVAGALAAADPKTKKFNWMSWACCGAVICAIVAAVMIGWGSRDLGAKEKGTAGYNTAIAAVAVGIFIMLCAACTVKMAD